MTNDNRNLIIEAIEAYGDEGLTKDELIQHLEGQVQNAARVVGQQTHWLIDDQIIELRRGRYVLTNTAKYGGRDIPTTAIYGVDAGKTDVPAYQKGRGQRSIHLYTSPVVIDDAVRVQVKIESQWVNIPIFGGLRICLGPETPMWSPEQETNRRVTCVRVVRRNGETMEYPVNPSDPVTVAPLEGDES